MVLAPLTDDTPWVVHIDATMHKRDRFVSARNWGEGASQPMYWDSKGTYGLTYYWRWMGWTDLT